MLKISILDDEQHALVNIDKLLASIEDVEVVFKSTSADDLIDFLIQEKTDVLFLDIKMPGQTGFDVLDKLKSLNINGFKVIFLTAYDNFAIKAVKYSACDYLLKPVVKDELIDAIDKVRATSGKTPDDMMQEIIKRLHNDRRIRINHANGVSFLNADDIVCAKSEGNYTELLLKNDEKKLVPKSLKSCLEELSMIDFRRVHKSWAVNIIFLSEYNRVKGYCELKWEGGRLSVPVSQRMLCNLTS